MTDRRQEIKRFLAAVCEQEQSYEIRILGSKPDNLVFKATAPEIERVAASLYKRETEQGEAEFENYYLIANPLRPDAEQFASDSNIEKRLILYFDFDCEKVATPELEQIIKNKNTETEIKRKAVHEQNKKLKERFTNKEISGSELRRLHQSADPLKTIKLFAANDTERADTKTRADDCVAYLSSRGCPQPLAEYDSGNGAAVLYRLNLSNSDQANDLIRNLLYSLSKEFGTDVAVFNAARLIRIPGFKNRKQEYRPSSESISNGELERLNKYSSIRTLDPTSTPIPTGVLLDLLTERNTSLIDFKAASVEKSTKQKAVQQTRLQTVCPDKQLRALSSLKNKDSSEIAAIVTAWLNDCGVFVQREIRKGSQLFLYLDRCPVSGVSANSQSSTDISVIINDDGMLGYSNRHDRGEGIGWKDVRSSLDPSYKPVTLLAFEKEEIDGMQELEIPTLSESATDLAVAIFVLASSKSEIVYCIERGHFYIWNNKVWIEDDGEHSRTANRIHKLLEKAPEKVQLKYQMLNKLNSLIGTLRKQCCKSFRTFNSHPLMLTVNNGTLDLNSGALSPSDKNHFISEMIPLDYSPTARSEKWESFLDGALQQDAEMISYCQRIAGYSLTGATKEHAMFAFIGQPGSGKSTFTEAISRMMGPMSVGMSVASLAESNSGTTPELARLPGKRLCVIPEVQRTKKLDVSLLKSLIAGDSINCNPKYLPAFDFIPQAKLIMTGNEKPKVGGDAGFFRRINVVPFTHVFTSPDRSIQHDLWNGRDHQEAILSWAVRGCMDWRLNGMQTPAIVKDQTEEYKEDENPIHDWMEACCCVRDPAAYTVFTDLWSSYFRHAERAGNKYPLAKNTFGEQLGALGYMGGRKSIEGKQQRVRLGIAIIPEGNFKAIETTTQHSAKWEPNSLILDADSIFDTDDE